MSPFEMIQSVEEEMNSTSKENEGFEEENIIQAYPTVEFPKQTLDQTITHYKGTMSFEEMMGHQDPLRQAEHFRCPPVSFDFITKEYS